jgi:molybdopterin converting factor subunit 1
MKVRVLYFAAVRDETKRDEEELELPEDVVTIRDFVCDMARRYPALEPRLATIRFAKNETFVELEEKLEDGDVVAVLPPLAGG